MVNGKTLVKNERKNLDKLKKLEEVFEADSNLKFNLEFVKKVMAYQIEINQAGRIKPLSSRITRKYLERYHNLIYKIITP